MGRMGNPDTSRCSVETDLINRLLRTELSDDSLKKTEEDQEMKSVDQSTTCKYCQFKTDSPLHRNIHSQMHRRRVIRDALHGLGWRSAKTRPEEATGELPRDSGATRILKEMVLRTSVGSKPEKTANRVAPVHWTTMGRLVRVDRGIVHKVLPRRMHECRRCGIFFRDALLHRLHMAMHAPGCSPFVCRLCGFQAQSALRFFEHINETAHDVEEAPEEAQPIDFTVRRRSREP